MLRRSAFNGISALSFCLFLFTLDASSQVLTLPYNPVTAEYSNALDKIIFIAANPNQLHIFDPSTSTDTTVNLPQTPLSLSVSLDGLHAAVGHDALISYVNLQTASLEKTIAATVTVNSLVLGNDYVYVLTYDSGTISIQISTGTTSTHGVYDGTAGRLHPSGTAIYTTDDGSTPENVEDLNVSTGPVTSANRGLYFGDYGVCGGVWFSPDGRRIYTGCATVYQASPQDEPSFQLVGSSMTLDTNLDSLYWTTLQGATKIQSLTESAALSRVAAIPNATSYTTPPVNDNQVLLYDSAYLEPAGTFQLRNFTANGNSYQAHGKQVFFNQGSTAMYVVMQADSASGLSNDFAVQVFQLSNPTACLPAFNSASATAGASGTIATAGITAPATCIYQASSNSNWIQVASGAYGSGNGTLTYIVRPNSGADRTGTITLGGQTFTVTQSAAAMPPNALAPLGYSVAGADYSKALDKVVLIVSNPRELHIYDPVSGSGQTVALPKTPFFVSVSPDGLSAAVGFDGWVSIVNLSTATVTSTLQLFTDVHTILLAGNGYFYAYPQNTVGELFSVQIATSTITMTPAIYAGRFPRLYADGNSFYAENSKWNISQGPASYINENVPGRCAPFWLSEDGARMVTSCGKALTTSPVQSLDLQYNGSLSSAASIQWASESDILHSTFLIPAVVFGGPNTADTYVQTYGDTYLGYAGELSLASFVAGSTLYAGHGRYVFHNAAADKLIVLEQADSSASLVADYGVTVYPLTTPASGCSFTLGANSAGLYAAGGLETASVTTGGNCIWESASNASWIGVDSGTVGFGTAAITYTVAPNSGAGPRSGTLTIAGQTFTVTQGGQAPLLSIRETHLGNFIQAQQNATYTVLVSNAANAGPTSGTVTVTETVPAGLTLASMIGSGWTCAGNTCSRSDALNGGSSYAPITVTVNVAANAVSPQVNSVSVSGAGFATANATDSTTITTTHVLDDFYGDDTPDLVWENDSTTQVSVHYYGGLGGAVYQGWNWLDQDGAPGWHVAAIADFNRDGHPDLVWQNDSTRQVVVHYYGGAGGATYLGWSWLNQAGAPGWHVAGAADFNGDGYPDLVWQSDTTRAATVHYFGGSGGATDQGWKWLNQTGAPGWSVVAIADFNGDGVPDLVWQNDATSATTVQYYGGLGGATVQGWNWLNQTGAAGWHVKAAADFNGDGHPDLVWQSDTTRQVTVQYYGGPGGAVYQSWSWLQQTGVPGWSVK